MKDRTHDDARLFPSCDLRKGIVFPSLSYSPGRRVATSESVPGTAGTTFGGASSPGPLIRHEQRPPVYILDQLRLVFLSRNLVPRKVVQSVRMKHR